MKRVFDVSFGIILLLELSPLFLFLAMIIKINSKGPVIFWSDRVGKSADIFLMPKLRTMSIETPAVATHLFDKPDLYLTPIGPFLRKTSLDELPQLYSIIRGEMSFVGPRPALHNQYDLIKLREETGVNDLRPGLTGWAQVNGRDEISIQEKAVLDEQYLKKLSWKMDLHILWLTLIKVIKKDSVTH